MPGGLSSPDCFPAPTTRPISGQKKVSLVSAPNQPSTGTTGYQTKRNVDETGRALSVGDGTAQTDCGANKTL
eukprot:3438064-Pyramimonas_sp.AAC.1